MAVRPAKTQISLGIRPVWSESSLSAWRKLGSLATHWVHSEDWSDCWSVRVSEQLALPTSDHGVAGSNPAGGEILPESKRRFIAQSLSYSPFHRLEITEILLKGRKTLTHPSIWSNWADAQADPSLRWAHTHLLVLSCRGSFIQSLVLMLILTKSKVWKAGGRGGGSLIKDHVNRDIT